MRLSPQLHRISERGKKWMMSVISFTVLCALFGVLAYELTKKPVTVILDGQKQQVSVHADTVRGLLQDLHVKVGKHDLVKPGLDAALESDMTVRWKPAVQVKMAQNGDMETAWTTADTVGDFFKAHNIQTGEHDKFSPALDTPISKGMAISYAAGFPVHVKVAGKKKTVWTTNHSATVEQFLQKQNVKYDENDQVKPGLKTPLLAADNITVTHISKKKVTDIVPVDYAVVTKKDDSLPKGEKKVVNSGKKGQLKKIYAVTMQNGKQVSRKLVDTKKIKASEDRIVAVGTKVYSQPSRGKSSSRDESSGSGQGSGSSDSAKQFYVSSTAYTADCSGCSGLTSTGLNLKTHPDAKVIAVDPDVIPLGSKVWVQGYGYAIAADTGGSINGHTIDVFFPTKSGAYSWGTRTVLVKVLN
ncbi:MAG TPA: ubiquitin-like domain-containing protein [Bacillales bacterium]|nr:ubiquitin-like domain-containing protein [Bacillales bacterium]